MRYNLSEITDVIEDRRTIFPEQFSKRKVHREIIEKLLNVARWAPTHKLTQPWKFSVFREEGLNRLSEFQSQTYSQITPEDKFSERKFLKLKERPLKSSAVIFVTMSPDPDRRVPEIEEIASVAAAVQNMSLLATAYGLGFYWSSGGLTYRDELKEFLNLEESDKVMGTIYVGYPDIDWPRKTPRKPIEYFTHWEE
ncbi:nitroreductase [bacterium SCSIO 12741]|nr:nitroreductase [bacterium SCSIO 12741]